MKKYFVVLITLVASALALPGCNQPAYKNPHILVITAFGDIEVELYPDQAPKTVAAFLSYVDGGIYTKGAFYRVVLMEGLSSAGNTGLIQGGVWQTNDPKHAEIPGIEHEPTSKTGLSHTNGTISLARTTPGSANTEFFICIGDQTQFDFGKEGVGDGQGFSAFGKVVNGMQAVRKIQEQRKRDQQFEEPIIIQKIKRL